MRYSADSRTVWNADRKNRTASFAPSPILPACAGGRKLFATAVAETTEEKQAFSHCLVCGSHTNISNICNICQYIAGEETPDWTLLIMYHSEVSRNAEGFSPCWPFEEPCTIQNWVARLKYRFAVVKGEGSK